MDATTAKLRARTRLQITNCHRCPLHATCTSPVPFSGPSPAPFAIVGEAPGTEEDAAGQPFIGPSGRLLRKLLSEHRIDPTTALILNTISCLPARTPPTPTEPEIAACRPNLLAQLELAQAPYILLAGSVALSAFRPDLKITAVHGNPFFLTPGDQHSPVCFPVFHPAAALRAQAPMNALRTDLARFARLLAQPAWYRGDAWPDACWKCGAGMWVLDHDGLVYCQEHDPRLTRGREPVPELVAVQESLEMA